MIAPTPADANPKPVGLADPARPAPTRLRDLMAGRANNFDAIRFALAMLVLFSHCYPLLRGGKNTTEPLMVATGGQVSFGDAAVDIFFIISGLLITQSWQASRSTSSYLLKRVLRIYPGYLVAVLICTAVVVPLATAGSGTPPPRPSAVQAILRPLNLQDNLPHVFKAQPEGAVNGSLWSIRYEFLCYLLVAAFGLSGLLRGRLGVAAVLAGATIVFAAQQYMKVHIRGSTLRDIICDPFVWPRVLTCFSAGMAAYVFRDLIPYSRAWLVAACVALIASAALPRAHMLPWVLPFAAAYVTFYLAYAPGLRLHDFARRGDFSYGTYLYAFPVQQLLIQYIGRDRLSPIGLFAIAAPITLGLAVASWHLVERPFLKLKRTPIPGQASEQRLP